MLKNIFIIIFFVFSTSTVSQTLSAEVQYSCSLINNPFAKELENKKKMDTTPQHVKDTYKKFIENSVPINYTLKFNNNTSIFKKIKTMTNDANTGFNITKAMGATGVTYTNLVTHERINTQKSVAGALIIQGDINDT